MTGRSDLLRGALRERLRRLRMVDRDLVMRAAAIGRQFDAEALCEIAAAPRGRIDAALRAAVRLQIIEPVAEMQGRFRFRHALTHDAVYGELVAAQLQPLHREIASALERLAPRCGTDIEQLAYHWWAARDADRGVRYNEEAGDRAGALHATEQALLHYARALEVGPKRGPVYERIGAKIASEEARLRVGRAVR